MAQKIPSTASSHFRWCMLTIRGLDYCHLMIRGLDHCLLMIRGLYYCFFMIRGLDHCLPMICLRWLTCWRCPRSSQWRPRVSATCDPCRQQCQEGSEGTHEYCNVCCEKKKLFQVDKWWLHLFSKPYKSCKRWWCRALGSWWYWSYFTQYWKDMIMNMMAGSKPWPDRWRWWGLCWWWRWW